MAAGFRLLKEKVGDLVPGGCYSILLWRFLLSFVFFSNVTKMPWLELVRAGADTED